MKDASRSVPVVAQLLSDELRPKLMAEVKADYDSLRARHAAKTHRAAAGLDREGPRANATPIDWSGYRPPVPHLVAAAGEGAAAPAVRQRRRHEITQFVRTFKDYPIAELRDYIDWGPFFLAWEMKGRFPDILNNPATGEAATQALPGRAADARPAHRREVAARQRRHRACSRPTRSVTTSRSTPTRPARPWRRRCTPCASRASTARASPTGRCPTSSRPTTTGLRDHVGAFAVTAGLGSHEKVNEFKAAIDDYNAILLEALADRLAEAFAERMHERVRHDFWGYAPDEHLKNDDLIAEKYVGIRPAPGYPACPDHTEKELLWDLLRSRRTPAWMLTESMAMWPGASVCGWYFSHPQSQYFVVGRLGRDQVEDYAKRKGWTLAEAERWLAPNLGYLPED